MTTHSTAVLAGYALLTCLAANGTTLSVAELAPNDLVITEYLANPVGVSDADGEYFEIFNATNDVIDLAGLVVRDDGSNSFTVSALIVAPRAFAVLASSDGMPLGLSPSYIYGSGMSLTNGDDEIGLYRPDDTLIGKLAYTDGDSFGAGVAHELDVLNASTPVLLSGPTAGADFVAATAALPLGNFGSPGAAGNTQIPVPAVPLPAGIWMFLSALSMLGWKRRRRLVFDRLPGDRHARTPQPNPAALCAGGHLAVVGGVYRGTRGILR